MNSSHVISPDRDVTVTIELAVEEISPKFTEAFNDFRMRARIPGFRPGKVPMDLIRKRYGREIMAEIIDEVTKEKLKEYLTAEKLNPAGRININLIEYGEGKPLRFEVTFPLAPEVSIGEYKGLRILLSEAEVTDGDVEQQIDGLRHKHAHLHSIETPAPIGAIVSVKVHEVHASGLPLLGRPVEEKQIEFGADALGAGTDEQLLGVKAGETRVIRVREEASGLTGAPQAHTIITPAEANQQQSEGYRTYSVEATRVEVPHLPELDDDFAQQINPSLKSFDDLKQYTKIMLMSYASQAMHQQLEGSIIGRLIEDNPFAVPRGIIEATLEDIADDMKVPQDQRKQFIEEHFREAEHDYRWVLLRDEIAKREKIEVGDEELNQELQRIAERSGESMDAISRRYADDDKLEKLRGRLYEHRIINFLAENAEIEKRTVPLMDLLRMAG